MKKAGPTAWVQTRIDGHLGWWPAESARRLRSGAVRCVVSHLGRTHTVIVPADRVSATRPSGA